MQCCCVLLYTQQWVALVCGTAFGGMVHGVDACMGLMRVCLLCVWGGGV